uniref:Minor tail protein n=1 Tax=Decurrovirus sp. TaxID=2832697 RepID=A0AAU8HXJ1_9CAUD
MKHEAGPIASARADVVAILEAATDLPIVANVPERLQPPCVVVTEAAPLLQTDETTYGAVSVKLSLTVAVAPTTNALAVARLDEAVDAIAVALIREGTFAAVDAYTGVKSADGQTYLAAPITTTLTYSIGRTPQ